MSIKWLTVQSFRSSQELITAINTLSIHTKLLLIGNNDNDRKQSVEEAKQKLSSFFAEFEEVVGEQKDIDKPVLGANPRLRQLARSFIKAKHNRKFRSKLVKERLSVIRDLLYSNDEDDRRSLVNCLSDLRVILEEHVQADTNKMLGGF